MLRVRAGVGAVAGVAVQGRCEGVGQWDDTGAEAQAVKGDRVRLAEQEDSDQDEAELGH